ncbi:putative sugar ABC transporter permease [Thermoclostridium stercorarium subsp. stercorarium DSM 8532]|jgi:multiple sugar transport system permease protein|uniref:ABC transporter permease n=3 Tax=Thermoclostridium stercorarium TaxID=1510 RepID=A0A1B1YJS6_THEST|nr:sugar ABC transporter permease [Thermoclostridium stercorarium]AGC68113.1 putative sugar ABC transporter permease [Thermoclostridium stercorarium subsp. stercorarium DSM 8532]ANW98494.1 ABC transporter permease [Thermoclostridium stercorarium subsp. thermolacticum DSM 2910]ANX01028.1 ABC transporter permease [Thermoclostridium stercorarium subsp. leptospartum DSM 9219]UZQ86639.1 sugar ABC transporter permease [Thermoclostridium stercorarium]
MKALKTGKKLSSRENNLNAYVFLAPYLLLFLVFILIPIAMAIMLSVTNFNTLEFPDFVGLMNYVNLVTQDEIFMQYVLPNTITYALIVGPGGYILSFLVAWALSQLPKVPRTILALVFYSPSITSGVAMNVLWRILFSGDQAGYINAWLIRLGIITEPVQWLTDKRYLLTIMIIVALWSSMGVGFLAILAGILNQDETLYEAAAIDGVKNRFQEVIYITIPAMKPQMLFAAVMSIVNTFQNGMIGVQLSGANPTPGYAGQLVVNHIEDYGFIRYEMGYASAVSVVLLLTVYVFSRVSKRLFSEREY